MGWKMIINKSKLAVIAAVAAASIALPVFAQAATTTAHRHRHAHRTVANQPAAPGYRANAAVAPGADPVDDPSMTGGGNPGYNACAGHPRC
jgi:hypothetical protein